MASAASAAEPAGVSAFIRDRHLTRYNVALADLNSVKQPEALIYAMATAGSNGQSDLCGSGGCNLYVLSLQPTGYSVVATVRLSRPPIRVLLGQTRGWHDLGVWVAGGGIIAGYEARLRFDGHEYPGNPTVSPAVRTNDQTGETAIASMP